MEPRHQQKSAPVIRAARRADVKRMGEIYVAAWRDAYPTLLPPETLLHMSAERWARQFAVTIARGREIVLIAEDADHNVTGLATGGAALDAGLMISGQRVAGEIFALYVAPESLGAGAGAGLVKAMLRRFALRGEQSAAAWMLKGNPSRFFYEHLGARLIAEKEERRFGRTLRLEAYGWSDLSRFAARSARH